MADRQRRSIAADTGSGDAAIGNDTVRSYLDALERLMVVENQPAWAPHLRSRSRLRQGPKRRFVDPSLAVAAIDEASETLRRFADRIDTKKCGDPSLLAVITGNGFGYVRPDGVAVIPIGSLGP
jgi:hypothetical protein